MRRLSTCAVLCTTLTALVVAGATSADEKKAERMDDESEYGPEEFEETYYCFDWETLLECFDVCPEDEKMVRESAESTRRSTG